VEGIGGGVGAGRWRERRESARGRVGSEFERWRRVFGYGSRCTSNHNRKKNDYV
jgi:hypothetical protein